MLDLATTAMYGQPKTLRPRSSANLHWLGLHSGCLVNHTSAYMTAGRGICLTSLRYHLLLHENRAIQRGECVGLFSCVLLLCDYLASNIGRTM
jgi:hypothetical protein